MFHSRGSVRSLSNWPVYALKAGLAAFLARQLCLWTGVEDPVSAAFVAVVAASPTLHTGLRSSLWQVAGSLAGGVIAVGVLWLVPSQGWALALAVALAVIITGPFFAGQAHVVAAFTALYVVLLSQGDAVVRTEHRMGGVLLGGAASFLVNFSITALMYQQVFRRRMALADSALESVIREDADGETIFAVEGLLRQLLAELRDADRDSWLFSRRTRRLILHFQEECAAQLQVLDEWRILRASRTAGTDLLFQEPDTSEPSARTSSPAQAVQGDKSGHGLRFQQALDRRRALQADRP